MPSQSPLVARFVFADGAAVSDVLVLGLHVQPQADGGGVGVLAELAKVPVGNRTQLRSSIMKHKLFFAETLSPLPPPLTRKIKQYKGLGHTGA